MMIGERSLFLYNTYTITGAHTEGVGWGRLKKGFAGNNA